MHLDIGAAARAIAQSKAVGGVFQGDGGLAHQPAALSVSPEVHGLRAIDEMDRLFYPFCVCGAVGRGFLTPDRAKHFECPRQAAEIEVAANWAEYERAVEFVSGGPRRGIALAVDSVPRSARRVDGTGNDDSEGGLDGDCGQEQR